MKLREKIAEAARVRGLELTEVARRANIPYGTLRNYLRAEGDRAPSVYTGIALAQALDVAIEWLFTEDNDNCPPRYIPPEPSGMIDYLCPNGVDWDEVACALTLYRHDERCRKVSRLAALFLEEGNRPEADAAETYLRILREHWDAVHKGDLDHAIVLREQLQRINEEHPLLREIAEKTHPVDSAEPIRQAKAAQSQAS